MIADATFTLITFAAGGVCGCFFGWLLGVTRYFGVRQ